MTPALRRACERERAASAQPEPIRPIVRRVVTEIGRQYPAFRSEPAVITLLASNG